MSNDLTPLEREAEQRGDAEYQGEPISPDTYHGYTTGFIAGRTISHAQLAEAAEALTAGFGHDNWEDDARIALEAAGLVIEEKHHA